MSPYTDLRHVQRRACRQVRRDRGIAWVRWADLPADLRAMTPHSLRFADGTTTNIQKIAGRFDVKLYTGRLSVESYWNDTSPGAEPGAMVLRTGSTSKSFITSHDLRGPSGQRIMLAIATYLRRMCCEPDAPVRGVHNFRSIEVPGRAELKPRPRYSYYTEP